MNLFVNDIPVRLLELKKLPSRENYNVILNPSKELVTKAKLINHVCINKAKLDHIDSIFDQINSKVPSSLLSMDISVDSYDSAKSYLKNKFKIVKAAGGLVRKKDKFLMIYRMKKWDLPKGKKEKGENYRQTAIREIEEECGVVVSPKKKICTTWHTYTMNKNSMIKKTRWYLMDLLDDSNINPCFEEGIDELKWMTQKEVYHALVNSYKSINFVFKKYYKMSESSMT